MRNESMLIQAIRIHANNHYSQGWDAVVEAFTDGDILEYLSESDFDLPKTILSIQEWIDLRKEMEENCQF